MNTFDIFLLIISFVIYTGVLIFLTHKVSYTKGFNDGFRIRRKEQRRKIKPIPEAIAEIENNIIRQSRLKQPI